MPALLVRDAIEHAGALRPKPTSGGDATEVSTWRWSHSDDCRRRFGGDGACSGRPSRARPKRRARGPSNHALLPNSKTGANPPNIIRLPSNGIGLLCGLSRESLMTFVIAASRVALF